MLDFLNVASIEEHGEDYERKQHKSNQRVLPSLLLAPLHFLGAPPLRKKQEKSGELGLMTEKVDCNLKIFKQNIYT